jgi:hypothetical protein
MWYYSLRVLISIYTYHIFSYILHLDTQSDSNNEKLLEEENIEKQDLYYSDGDLINGDLIDTLSENTNTNTNDLLEEETHVPMINIVVDVVNTIYNDDKIDDN